jgi:amidase
MTALHKTPAAEIARLVHTGEVSALEVTNHFLRRIEAHNDQLQAFVYVASVRARRRALAIDLARRRKKLPPLSAMPLCGVPMGIKDLYPVRLMPMRGGSAAATLIMPFDSDNVRRLKAAGAVVLGKLATSELGAMPFTEPDIHPPTRNPWDVSTTTGGSSGGTAAAMAAGLVGLGHGSDGGGSIRIPAAMCGLFGFKSSRGALFHNSAPEKLGLSCEGPLSKNVDDAVLMLRALATDGRFAQPVSVPKRLKVKLVLESSEPALAGPVHPLLKTASERLARALTDAGHDVEIVAPVPMGLEGFVPLWRRTLAWVPIPQRLDSRLQPITRWLRAAGRDLDEGEIRKHFAYVVDVVDTWFGDADLVVTPATACLPPAIGSWKRDDPKASFETAVPMAVFTAAFNAGGQPAMTVPVVVDGAAQPLGVQVAARRGEDALLLAVAKDLEVRLGGFAHTPPQFA